MRKKKKALRSPVMTTVLFAIAAVLLVGGSIGSTQAALNIDSNDYTAQFQLSDIGVTLTENGVDVSSRNYSPNSNSNNGDYTHWDESAGPLLSDMLSETGGELKLGYAYEEVLAVENKGSIPEFVRVKVYHYWTDLNGNKLPDLDPSLIKLGWANTGSGQSWAIDSNAHTAERDILYYRGILNNDGKPTVPFATTLTIDNGVPYKVVQTTSEDGTTITTKYDYGNVSFVLDIEVDGVQTHNGKLAVRSAWGLTDADLTRLGLTGYIK